MKESQLKLFLKKIVTEAKLLEKINDPSKDEMFEYLRQMYGNEEDFRDSAEVAIYWFANFYHSGQSSNLYSVLSTSRFHPGPIAKGPEKDSMEEIMYEDLVLKFAPGSEDAIEIQKKHNSLNEAYEHESSIKKKIYSALQREGFQQKGSTPREYMEFYISGFATVSCNVNVYDSTIFFDRYYDSERVDTMPGYHIEKTIPLTDDPKQADKIIQICIKLKKSIEGDESILGGIDDISENESETPVDLNSADANVLYGQMLDIANMDDPSYRLITALKTAIDKRVTDPNEKRQLVAVFNKEFGGSHTKGHGDNTAWSYYTKERLQEGDEADAVNDMWAGSDDDLNAHGFEEPKKPHTGKQKSKQFFGKKQTDVRDMDWDRVQNRINRDTLKESKETEYRVDYGVAGLEGIEPTYHGTVKEAWIAARQFIQNYSTQKSRKAGEKVEVLKNGYAIRDGSGATVVIAVVQENSPLREENSVSDDDVDYVEYVSQRTNEKPFKLKTGNGMEKFEYVNAKYPSGKVDIGVYAFRGDVVYGYKHFRKIFNLP